MFDTDNLPGNIKGFIRKLVQEKAEAVRENLILKSKLAAATSKLVCK